MPPKIKISKEDVISATIDLVRKGGKNQINARAIASYLNCSTQPIFSNFSSMDELMIAVFERADEISRNYVNSEIEKGEFPVYKANGMAYIRFAKEEKELFKLLYMTRIREENLAFQTNSWNQMKKLVQNNTGLSEDTAHLFHLEMWAFVHGIASMFATSFLDLDWDLVSKMLTDAYLGLKTQYEGR